MARLQLSRRELAGLAALPLLAGLVPSFPARAVAATSRKGLPKMRASLYPFATAPFPYNGVVPVTGEPFLDTVVDGRLGHNSPRGGVYFEDPTYSDNRVLVAMPGGFDPGLPAMIVVFFHGNQAVLERDVVGRDRVLAQLQASHLNAALLAPQFAVDALDSSAGKFYEDGAFERFLNEASVKLADLWGDRNAWKRFSELPVVLVAFSGGYNPAIYSASVGGAWRRIAGIVLFDALYGEIERFADWIAAYNRQSFFLSCYTEDLISENEELRQMLDVRGVRYMSGLPRDLRPGEVAFLDTPNLEHKEFITQAWVRNPLTDVLNRMAGYPRG